MNQGKLDIVKQEVARVNSETLGTSELKWMGMGKFNSHDHYIYYCGQESLRRNEIALRVSKRVQNAVLGCNLKIDRIISVRSQGKPFITTVIQVYAPTIDAKEAEVILIVTVNSIQRTHVEMSQGKCAGQGLRGHQISSFPCLLP